MDLAIENRRGKRWRAGLDIVCIVVIALAFLADVTDLVGYLRNPAAYPIGSEAAGFRYASRGHFVGATVGASILYAIGLFACVFTKDSRRKTALRVAVALWAILSTAWFIIAAR